MIDYLYQVSDLSLFLLLSFIFISISILSLFFIKSFMPLHLRYQENAVIGCISALIIVIYGVLAGFATLNLVNNNDYTTDAVQREANAVANVYRDSRWLSEPSHSHIQADIKHYLEQVIKVEWPLMNKGEIIPNKGDFIIDDIFGELNHYKINNVSDSLILTDLLVVSRNLYDARQQRIQMSYSSLSAQVWVVIIVGTILTLLVNYLFGVNFYLHIFIAIAAALMTASIIYLLISLDKPFQGGYILGSNIFESVSAFINKTET